MLWTCEHETHAGAGNIWESVVAWFKKPQITKNNSTSGSDVQILSVLSFQMCIVKEGRYSDLIRV